MKRKVVFIALVLLLGSFVILLSYKNRGLQAELLNVIEENIGLKNQLAAEEIPYFVDSVEPPSEEQTLTYIEKEMIERIRWELSDYDMEVVAVCPVGEDSSVNVKRFYICYESYDTTFYLADLLTGEIYDLTRRIPWIDVVNMDADDIESEILENNVRIDDFDGDQLEDILFINPYEKTGGRVRSGILLWLQKDGEFVPVNDIYCGYYSERENNLFSMQIKEYDRKLAEEKQLEDWDIDEIAAWVKEDLFDGKEVELTQILQNPVEKIHYTERREPEAVQVTVSEDEKGLYQVLIPENPYSEIRINEWLRDLYDEEEPKVKDEKNDYYNWSVWVKRTDDAIISFLINKYTYTGGANGTSYTYSVNFDTRSGRVLQMSDVMEEEEDFYAVALEYIYSNYEKYSWKKEEIRDAMLYGQWCMTDYGINIFLEGGIGLFQYEIPYEEIAPYMKEEYLPTSRAAEFDLYMEGSAKMDVNEDGILDTVIAPAYNEDGWEVVINGTVTEIFPEWEGISVKEAEYYGTSLRRDDKGITYLHWRAPIYFDEVNSKRIIFIYRIEEERVVFEEAYADD